MRYILAIDQGTTSSRAVVFDDRMRPCGQAQEEFAQHFPRSGWVEHAPDDLWQSVLSTCEGALKDAGIAAEALAGIGISNQRETTLLWERATGRALHNAIVWQDRRTSEACAALKEAGHEAVVRARTGLLLDPYFSGTKLGWLLDNVEGARTRAEAGELAFAANVGALVEPTAKTDVITGGGLLPPNLFSHNSQQNYWQSVEAYGAQKIGWGGRIAQLYHIIYHPLQAHFSTIIWMINSCNSVCL